MTKGKTEEVIALPKLELETLEITLIGDSDLIQHRWSEKAKKEMLDKQTQKAKQKKAKKDPEQDFIDATYVDDKGNYVFPSIAFKASAVTACTSLDITKVAARQAFHVLGEFVPLEGPPPEMREDMVRIGMGTADIRYRPGFKNWRATIFVRYNKSTMSAEQVINLFNVAGFGVGVGEWRPEKNGSYGRFHVATTEDMQVAAE